VQVWKNITFISDTKGLADSRNRQPISAKANSKFMKQLDESIIKSLKLSKKVCLF
jgi:hypothetical protein